MLLSSLRMPSAYALRGQSGIEVAAMSPSRRNRNTLPAMIPDSESLVADLSQAALEEEIEAEERYHRSLLENGSDGGDGPFTPANPPDNWRRTSTQAILTRMASDQGNSGLLSVSPRSTGPFNSSRLRNRNQRTRARGMSMDGSELNPDGSSMTPDSFKHVATNTRAGRDSLPGRLRDRHGDRSHDGDLLRAAQTRNFMGMAPRQHQTQHIGMGIKVDGLPLMQRMDSGQERSSSDQIAIPTLNKDGLGESEEMDAPEVGEEEPTWAMIGRMRIWRQDAMLQHLYETAAFWGDKIWSWTAEPNDAFWLAQTYFLTGHYNRAEKMLLSDVPSPRLPRLDTNDAKAGSESQQTERPFLSSYALDSKQLPLRIDASRRFDEIVKESKTGLWGTLEALEQDKTQYDGLDGPSKWRNGKARLVDWSMPCRYLAALAMIHQEKFNEALELLGESNVFRTTGESMSALVGNSSTNGVVPGKNGFDIPSKNGDLKIEASICRLRGVLHLRLNSIHQAKESYMEALALDVRNYDVFNELVNEMMTPEEEWDFVQSLSYHAQLHGNDADFVKMIYTSRLSKNSHAKEIAKARQALVSKYNLGHNSDVLVAAAENMFTRFRYEDCHAITSLIIKDHPGHPIALPLHLACCAQIPRLASSLFMLAHKLVQDEPTSPVSWYAVGLWYFVGHRWEEARRYFAATHDEDTRFGPAWINFSHCFAFEGEHEQAITAYSTTARLFPGSYFPHLCIGMEQLQLNNLELAAEALNAAYAICPTDPLLLNELGVAAYDRNEFEEAIDYYQRALAEAETVQGLASIWSVTHCNLGHAYRRAGQLTQAKKSYAAAIRMDALNVTAYTSLGMVAHLQGEVGVAIERYHQALAISPQDALATVLLEIALPDLVEMGATRIPGVPSILADPAFNAFDPLQTGQLVDVEQMPVLSVEAAIDVRNFKHSLDMDGSVVNVQAEGSTMDIEE